MVRFENFVRVRASPHVPRVCAKNELLETTEKNERKGKTPFGTHRGCGALGNESRNNIPSFRRRLRFAPGREEEISGVWRWGTFVRDCRPAKLDFVRWVSSII